MGQIDFNTFQRRTQTTTSNYNMNGGGRSRVSFFSLKQDKDQAIVRFLIDSPDDFDIVACHRMNVNGTDRNINCIREIQEPIDKCPLCAQGVKLNYKLFIHLLRYDRDEMGNIVATPCVWERPTSLTNTFMNLLNEYGPLSESIFKITRNGAVGQQGTKYDITYCRADIYKPELYVKDTSAFEGYTVVGNGVFDFDYNRLAELVGMPKKEEIEEDDYASQPYPYGTGYTAQQYSQDVAPVSDSVAHASSAVQPQEPHTDAVLVPRGNSPVAAANPPQGTWRTYDNNARSAPITAERPAVQAPSTASDPMQAPQGRQRRFY